jgi:lipopolysaccharide export system protein LptA
MALAPLVALFLAAGVLAAEAPQQAEPQDGKGIGLETSFFKKDEPIEITADRLDVDQVEKRATFGGNVHAVQGDVRLAGQSLTVFYDQAGAGEQTAAADAADAGEDGASGGRIRRMEVQGGVHVSSPKETATGDEGVYDLEEGMITLIGNVILTRGENILRGARLNIDVDSGRSVILGSSDSGRVKGLFVPKRETLERTGAAAPQTNAAP